MNYFKKRPLIRKRELFAMQNRLKINGRCRMKKKMTFFALISVFLLLMAGCTTKGKGKGKGKLTRIDVLTGNQGETHIQDKDTFELVEKLSEQIKWEPNKIPSMAREADVKVVFFFEVKKNLPEKLTEYEIWFNENTGTATIISTNEKEGYGMLDKENATALKNIFIK